MTLDYAIWEIIEADGKKAEEGYREALKNTPPEERDRRPVEDEDFNIAAFDDSRRYEECMAN